MREAPAVRAQRLGGLMYTALLARGLSEPEADLFAAELERRMLEGDERPTELVERDVLPQEQW